MKFEDVNTSIPTGWEATPLKRRGELYRVRYEQLVEQLATLGTIVSVRSMVEANAERKDKPTDPTVWKTRTNSALVEVIFPKQDTKQTVRDNSYALASGEGYKATRVVEDVPYDRSQVTGHLRIQYDSSDTALFHISDFMGQSTLPEDVCSAIEAAFSEQT